MEKAIAALLCFEWGLGLLNAQPRFFTHTSRKGGAVSTQIIFGKISGKSIELDTLPNPEHFEFSVIVIPEKKGNNVVLVNSKAMLEIMHDKWFVLATDLVKVIRAKTEMEFTNASNLFSRNRGVVQEGQAELQA
jgi:hypothetical protein